MAYVEQFAFVYKRELYCQKYNNKKKSLILCLNQLVTNKLHQNVLAYEKYLFFTLIFPTFKIQILK